MIANLVTFGLRSFPVIYTGEFRNDDEKRCVQVALVQLRNRDIQMHSPRIATGEGNGCQMAIQRQHAKRRSLSKTVRRQENAEQLCTQMKKLSHSSLGF